jgi:hypothetical protein
VGFIDGMKISGKIEKIMHGVKVVIFDQVLVALEKGRAEAVGPGTGIIVHAEKGSADFA